MMFAGLPAKRSVYRAENELFEKPRNRNRAGPSSAPMVDFDIVEFHCCYGCCVYVQFRIF